MFAALWGMAEASVPLAAAVRLGNRIKFNYEKDKDPIKREISEADTPELILISTSSGGNLGETSSTSRLTRQYDWIMATGDLSITNKLLPLEWVLFCAMAKWPTTLAALQWPAGWPFVKRMNLTNVQSGMSDPDRNRGILGWSSVWSIEVEMHFRTSDMLAFNEES